MKLHPRAVALLSIILALAFWLADSCIHYFLYREPTFQLIPQDINELWMRTVICFLILSLGVVLARSGLARRQWADATQANSNVHRSQFDVVIVRLHMLVRRVETNQLTPEEFYALSKAAIQPTVDKLMELKK